jgi:hypothetical protein
MRLVLQLPAHLSVVVVDYAKEPQLREFGNLGPRWDIEGQRVDRMAMVGSARGGAAA